MSPDKQAVQAYLYEQIPLSKAIAVRVVGVFVALGI